MILGPTAGRGPLPRGEPPDAGNVARAGSGDPASLPLGEALAAQQVPVEVDATEDVVDPREPGTSLAAMLHAGAVGAPGRWRGHRWAPPVAPPELPHAVALALRHEISVGVARLIIG